MFKLRGITETDLASPKSLRELILAQVGGDVVSAKLDFPLGFITKSEKFWINNELDMKDARDIFGSGKLTLWCTGKEKRGKKRASQERHSDSDENSEDFGSVGKKRRGTTEERASRVQELKAELCDKHGSLYSGVQYALWAEMIVAGTHTSMEEIPVAPMFGGTRSRGRATQLQASPIPDLSSDSPRESAELRGKYLQQLKEKEIGALTLSEYEEHRSIIVKLMKKL